MNRSFQHPLDHMDAQLFSAGSLLPLPALRLLVPPLQLISASTWWVVQQRDVLHYWAVADFVSMVMESVPELLLHKHWTQLCLGLRAKYVLELCRTEGLPDADLVTSHLDKVKAPPPGQEVEVEVDEEEVERLRSSFVELVHTLLKDPDEKQNFFSEVFPVEFGALYDSDLQTLFWEFLCRLAQLLPTPDLQQTASWLGGVPTVLDDCVRSVSQPADLKTLLQHHKRLGSLEQHVPPSSMGDHILASLSSAPPHNRSRPSGLLQGDAPLDAAAAVVEMVTVTDYAEVELGTSGEVPGLMGAQYFEGVEGRETKDEEEEESEGDPADTPPRAAAPVPLRPPSGLHDCPDCLKTFRFTSSLTAHRVVHTGERPHRCAHCGRSFSFRQSLDRHKHTHARHPPPEQQGAPEGGVNLAEKKEEPFVVALVPQLVDQVVSMVTVRTSGRQRKPSMKVRAMDSGEKAPAPRKRPAETAERPERPFNSSEHSYGSVVPMVTKHEAAAASSGSVPQTNAPPLQLLPSDGRFSCSDCDKSFRFRSLLLAHGRVHSGEQPYACTLCGRRFSFKQSLQRHQRTHGDGRQHPCPVCARRFSSLPACRRHQTVHADRHGEFPCTSCERTFRRKSTLVRHLKTHEQTGVAASTDLAPERPYACGCGKSFGHKAALAAHRRTHATERPHRCTQCDKAFLRRQGLRSHMRVHSPDMPFSCRFCGKRFKRQRNMRTHERGHTREGVFCCARCDRSFVYKATLTRHELMHSGERPFLCSDCGKRFLSHAELLKHQRFHSGLRPFSCDTCGRSFTQSCYLTLHLRRHSGVRPYACDDCGKSFLSADRLKRHRRTHTGERPYVCTVCGKRFGQSHHLKVHQRTHLHGSG